MYHAPHTAHRPLHTRHRAPHTRHCNTARCNAAAAQGTPALHTPPPLEPCADLLPSPYRLSQRTELHDYLKSDISQSSTTWLHKSRSYLFCLEFPFYLRGWKQILWSTPGPLPLFLSVATGFQLSAKSSWHSVKELFKSSWTLQKQPDLPFLADGSYLKGVAGCWEHVFGPRGGHGIPVSFLLLLCPFTVFLLQYHLVRLPKFSWTKRPRQGK